MLFFTTLLFGQQGEIMQAEQAYQKGDYSQAITLYEQVIAEWGSTPDLYYNLGNAYYKNQDYADAILNYERTLLFEPNHASAAHNLALANTQIVDKIDQVDPFFLQSWMQQLSFLYSSDAWAYLAISCFLLFLAGLLFYFFMRKVLFRKIGFYAAICFLLLTLFCNTFASMQKNRIEDRDYAIVYTPSVTVKSSPAKSGTDLFVIHEGLKVKVTATLGDWSEVELADGNIGWVLSTDIKFI